MTETQVWDDAINKEWDGLNDRGCFEHDLTRAELRKRGIHKRVIGMLAAATPVWPAFASPSLGRLAPVALTCLSAWLSPNIKRSRSTWTR